MVVTHCRGKTAQMQFRHTICRQYIGQFRQRYNLDRLRQFCHAALTAAGRQSIYKVKFDPCSNIGVQFFQQHGGQGLGIGNDKGMECHTV